MQLDEWGDAASRREYESKRRAVSTSGRWTVPASESDGWSESVYRARVRGGGGVERREHAARGYACSLTDP